MGGFEGGDEGGYWDVDDQAQWMNKDNQDTKKPDSKSDIEITDSGYSIKAHAKVNIFLKITGHKDGYHTLLSRFYACRRSL